MKKKRKARIGWDGEASPAKNASEQLPTLAQRYFEHGREAIREGATPRQIHRFRLATKHFRYTLEMFQTVYGPGLAARLKKLRGVQKLLGELNDLATARDWLQSGPAEERAAAEHLEGLLAAQSAMKTEEFREHWRREFDTDRGLQTWVDYLRKHTRR